MSKQTSADTLEAMKDQDRHTSGDSSSHAKDSGPVVHGHEHTKPAGDLRQVELKEDGEQVQRRDFARGQK